MKRRNGKVTKAGRLLKVAYATHRKGQKRIARDIFTLAMDDASAPQEFGEVSSDDLEAQLQSAVSGGDWGAASQALDALKSLPPPGEAAANDMPLDELDDMPLVDEDDDLLDEGEGALSPGDQVPPPPAPSLAPAQIASLVTLARKVNKGGHPDLAKRITKALGLP